MFKNDFNFWLNYHKGEFIGPLTEKQLKEIRACEFAMQLLLPTEIFLECCGGYKKMVEIYQDPKKISIVAASFRVEEEVVRMKMEYLIQKHEEQIQRRKKPFQKIKRKYFKRKNKVND